MRTEQGRLYLFAAIDRTSKFAFVELHEEVTRRVAGDFLRALIAAVPIRFNTVPTDNGAHFTEPNGNTWTPDEIKEMLARKEMFRATARPTCARPSRPSRPSGWQNRLEIHHTPKHGSRLNMAEAEFSALSPQCLPRRIS